jgi:hypothetical protein
MYLVKSGLIGLLGCLVLGCLVMAVTVVADPPPGKGGGGGGHDTPLCVEFRNDVTDRILSDDPSPYCDSVRRIKAVLERQSGGLQLNTQTGGPRMSGGRTLWLDFALACVVDLGDPCDHPNFPDVRFEFQDPDDTDSGYPNQGIILTGQEFEWNPDLEDWEPLGKLDLFDMPEHVAIRVGLLVRLEAVDEEGDTRLWRLDFKAWAPCTGNTPAWITRLDVDTWVIEVLDTDVACLLRGQESVPNGYYHMPFRITLDIEQ